VAVLAPVALGVNVTPTWQLELPASVPEQVLLARAKSPELVPVIEILLIVTEYGPTFEIVLV
jgi:hypothetical protein